MSLMDQASSVSTPVDLDDAVGFLPNNYLHDVTDASSNQDDLSRHDATDDDVLEDHVMDDDNDVMDDDDDDGAVAPTPGPQEMSLVNR